MYDIKRAKREKNIFSSHKPVEICQKRTHLETNFNAACERGECMILPLRHKYLRIIIISKNVNL